MSTKLKRKLAPALAAGALAVGGLFAAVPAAHATGNPSALDQGDLSLACKIQYGQSGWNAQLYGSTAYSWKCVSAAHPGEKRDVSVNTYCQHKLCERFEKYISGSLADVFSSQTNIKLDNRLVIFDIKDLPESLRQIMMLIISNFVKNQVMARPEKRLLIIDEGWLLLQHEESARFVAGLVRRARKYYLGVSIISQQANDFLKSDYGRAIASQSALRILMRQDTTTIKNVASEFNLSEYEESFLLTCERGDALLIADQNHVAVKVVASDKEHPLITTNPAELYAA